MVYEFKLPDIAEGVHEGEVVQWHVKEGQAVKEDQEMVEVMTDKATVMIKSPKTGTIAKLMAKEGEVVKVGAVLVTIDVGGASSTPPAKPAAAAAPPAAAEEKTLFDLPTSFSGASKLRKAPTAPAAAHAHPAPTQAPAGAQARSSTLAAPAIRWQAREKGIDLNTVPASGPNGRVTTSDWQDHLTTRSAEGPVSAPQGAMTGAMAHARSVAPTLLIGGTDEVVQLKGLRKAIHDNMRRSKDFAAHFTYWDEADVTELVKLRADAKELAHGMGIRLSYLPFIVKATVAALKKYPDINAWVDEQNRTLVRKKDFHIGIATATERGLTVVVVRDADKKSVFEIAREIESLAEKARTGKATLAELTGSTFTITSLGKDGGLGATPVINHPEVGILGIHKIEARAKVNDKREVEVRDCMNISGSYDHRWIDGHIAAEFHQLVISLLQQPNLLLLGTV